VVLGVLGLLYHLSYLTTDYSGRETPPYFYQAWYTMATINIALLIAGIVVGVQLVRRKARWIWAFLILEVLVVLDTFGPGLLWLHPRFGLSIGAATGIAGGTFVQVFILFPIWGSLAGLWAARRLNTQAHGPFRALAGRTFGPRRDV
jgi:hypothetical protein